MSSIAIHAGKALLSLSLVLLSACGGSPSTTGSTYTPVNNDINHAPTASSSTISTYSSTQYTGTLSGTDPDGDDLLFSIESLPQNGTVSILSTTTGDINYTAVSGYVGADQFTYMVADPSGSTASATITISVNPDPVSTPVPIDELFVDLPPNGNVPVVLHPGSTVLAGEVTKVAFGIPFPRATVDDVSQVIITDSSGLELASHIVELTRWKSLSSDTTINSLRSALIYVDAIFPDASPITLQVKYGESRILELGVQPAVQTTWVSIDNGPLPTEYPASEDIREPSVYATFPPDWLSACLLRGPAATFNSDPNYQWFDNAYLNFSYTAVNDVSDYVSPRYLVDYIGITGVGLDYRSDGYEPWLFDRAMTLFGLYIRTGDLKWLRHAHRASQFYAKHITDAGFFDLKSSVNDLKYSYGQALAIDLMLTGDVLLKEQIENVALAGSTWNETYTFSAGSTRLWTERHQTYALLAALSAWEVTGLDLYADRVNQITNASFNHALNPPNGWIANGSLMHTFNSHEGWAGDQPVASPWMSATFADAIMRYYIHSEDVDALIFLANLGDFISEVGTYSAQLHPSNPVRRLPYYLASDVVQHKTDGGWGDAEHTCDVAGATATAAWARGKLGGDFSTLVDTTKQLHETCQSNLDNWHREGADVNYGKTEWRLAPSRKYSWWFGSTHGTQWMLNSLQ